MLLEALKRRSDLKLFTSPWSPPAWMKVCTNDVIHTDMYVCIGEERRGEGWVSFKHQSGWGGIFSKNS